MNLGIPTREKSIQNSAANNIALIKESQKMNCATEISYK